MGSSDSAPPRGASNEKGEGKEEQYGIYVGGFGRPFNANIRKGHFENVTRAALQERLKPLASYKEQHVDKGYNIMFADKQDRDDALLTLRSRPFMFEDPNYGENYELWTKVGRDIATR